LSEKLEDPLLSKFLSDMELVFVREIKLIPMSISEELNSIMMKLMIDLVTVGNLNRDKSFLQHMLMLIKEQRFDNLTESPNREHVQLLAILKYVIQFVPPDLTDNSVILQITEGISENPNNIVNYTPMLIESFKKNDQVQQEIFPIFLKYMNRVGIQSFLDLLHSLKISTGFKRYSSLSNTLVEHVLEYEWKYDESLLEFMDLLAPDKDVVLKLWKKMNWDQDISHMHFFMMIKLFNNVHCYDEEKYLVLLKYLTKIIPILTPKLLSSMLEEMILMISLMNTFKGDNGIDLITLLLKLSDRFRYNLTIYLQIIELCVVYACKNIKFAETMISYFSEM
jgi:hypothetical protein